MVGHQWFTRINNPAARGAAAAPAAKQEPDMSSRFLCTRNKGTCHRLCAVVVLSTLCVLLLATCAALAVLYNHQTNRKSEKLFSHQSLSDRHSSLTKENNKLKRDNEILKEQNSRLDERNELVNRTTAELESTNLALSWKSSELTEKIVNLTSTNTQLTHEHEQLGQYSSEQEEQRLNMSQTIDLLVSSNTRLQEETRRLSETSDLLSDEMIQVKGENQELLEINDKFQGEIQNLTEVIGAFSKDDLEQLQEKVTQLQEQNQNLSAVLVREQQEAAEREGRRATEVEQMAADVHSSNEAYRSLDLRCPVANQKTRERICKNCHNSWKQFESKCYYFSSRTLNWSASKSWCRTQGGDLLVINSEQEQEFIFGSSRTPDPSGTRLWIGLSDEDEEGDWRWVDGSRVAPDEQYWLSRPGVGAEPDDWKLDDPLGEDCGHIDTSEDALKSWMDASCKIAYRWICEKKF
ncbi:asialoglycoprotein receptor 1-like [Hippoglossus hippoglossus]|uniref:asialoglycoprotein receptor 1-like n=1 Tax=Hippoglossus hippoglossus TaxID=8267 RepID=UPI00148D52E2|nr:asialoglycoprotein receptor 1-like [Hippoglossus hippoglossus]